MKKESITLKPVTDTADPLLTEIETIYTLSFPETERRDFPLLLNLLKDTPRFTLYALLKAGNCAGFLSTWQLEGFTYIEHFAIAFSQRNSGTGTAALQQFLRNCPTSVILEVEPPTDSLTCRRISFYNRLGFQLSPVPYKQPPYRAGEDWLNMCLMSCGNIDLPACFPSVISSIYTAVYHNQKQ
ncbi:hypothetical protein Barb6XT_02842 [Bacteroidales bacterium Barb6XT]|nr:hypothetical protein Barb6XT_02842 [Bacteroidales bacterium Barb6XT]